MRAYCKYNRSPEDKRVRLSTTVHPKTLAYLREKWEVSRYSAGETVDKLVAEAMEQKLRE